MTKPPGSHRPGQAKGIPKGLQEAANEFYLWVGHCIAGWADVEAFVFHILWKTLGCAEQKAAIVYFRSPTLEIRITLTSELVHSLLPKTQSGKQPNQDLKAWTSIIKKFDELKQTRNRIAHHPVSPKADVSGGFGGAFGSEAFGTQTESYWFENYVSEEEALRGRHENIGPLKVEDLRSHHIATLSLTMDLDDFLHQRLPAYL